MAWKVDKARDSNNNADQNPHLLLPRYNPLGCDVYLDVLTLEYLCVRRTHSQHTANNAQAYRRCPINIRIYDRKVCRTKFACVNLYAICEKEGQWHILLAICLVRIEINGNVIVCNATLQYLAQTNCPWTWNGKWRYTRLMAFVLWIYCWYIQSFLCKHIYGTFQFVIQRYRDGLRSIL